MPVADARALARHDLAEGRQVPLQHACIFVVDSCQIFFAEVTVGAENFSHRVKLKWNIFNTNF